jgi:hypothetical protein
MNSELARSKIGHGALRIVNVFGRPWETNMHIEYLDEASLVELGIDEYAPLPPRKSGPHPDDFYFDGPDDVDKEIELRLEAEAEWEFWRGFVEQEQRKEDSKFMAERPFDEHA